MDGAAGPRAVGAIAFARELVRTDQSATAAWVDRVPGPPILRAWLGAAGGKATRAACAFPLQPSVVWVNRQALRRFVAEQKRALDVALDAMVAELTKAGVVDPDDIRGMTLRAPVVVSDCRGDRRRPLPTVDWLLGDGG
ncbi:MAG: hypothetical protein U1E73_06950 [Planctomycetota bacterium]